MRLGFLPDGLLLQQYANDNTLSKYAYIMIDEAHERTTNTDMLLALLKKPIQQRSDLELVIISATINLERFCQYFGATNVFETKPQVNFVLIKHLETPPIAYDIAVIHWVKHIVKNEPTGHILVFMTSVREIEVASQGSLYPR
ncbi:hypothetical protein FGADI_2435 [Fusarium gaditjirri]|uniref:Helicase ATP-binding domain-containing protein n=1 Tax=Fusarium gaditjirri TaxID=282569 RepID=A0A8H4TI69_9HYPO|nr:hypothetical protein FGADI_2435 [Fusarium gaditjirri]